MYDEKIIYFIVLINWYLQGSITISYNRIHPPKEKNYDISKWTKFLYNLYFSVKINSLKVIRIHHDLTRMLITLFWKDQQSFYFSYTNPSCSFLNNYVKFQSCSLLSGYNIIINYINLYDFKVYIILHINSSQLNFEVIVNVNRL